ncbi:DUF1127 domain-containing protein [Pseudooctadecabacter jejudonensis]|uniref:DUF1127 domain-containing protein n=1 Tax=Pseudooctadecabacter jejudonensis TaxID=1391910 RepID=A0A1Y5RQV7_9RHOB|nr:DUF1127 domain-containing protein [Pseudooctadecabacter jejudonensis]SLN22848.1 hypothetical protein PSJ8397_00946 [Pseudooctadecabacter jejudonensis]
MTALTFARPRPSSAGRMRSIALMIAVVHERRALRRLTSRQMADMGVSAADIAREIQRPFWDFPTNRP